MSAAISDRRLAPARHDLATIAPADWRGIVAGPILSELPADAAAVVEEWADVRRPVIVRRRGTCETASGLPVGLPLPPSLGKRRIALLVPDHVTWTGRAAVGLGEARTAAPAGWHGAIDRLEALGSRLQVSPRVFGSLLWQRLTGLPYLHPASDLDLLWPIGDPAALPELVAGLAAVEASEGVRLDGELLLPAGSVNWREWATMSEGGEVLLKTAAGVRLAVRDAPMLQGARCC